MGHHPEVSALTITHNRRNLLKDAIASVLVQTCPVSEIIVVDNGSEEDIEALVRSFSDPRIKYHRINYIDCLPRLRNIALQHAHGEYVAFIDSDDLWHQDKIRICLETAIKSGADLVLSDCQVFDSTGVIEASTAEGMNRANTDCFGEIVHRNQSFAYGTNLFFRNTKSEIAFDERLWAGDHDFVLRMCAFHKSVYTDQILNFIRRHPGNMSGEGSKNDIVSHLEYNRTLKKLFQKNKIDRKLYRKIKSSNYIKTADAYYNRGRARRALPFALQSVRLRPNLLNTKVAIKIIVARLTGVYHPKARS